jgi:hypothetical protein
MRLADFPGTLRVYSAGNTSPPNDYQEFGLWDAIYNSGKLRHEHFSHKKCLSEILNIFKQL